MGTTLQLVVPLLATTALLLLSVARVTEAGFVQAPELTELRICDGQPCLIPLLRQKRQDADPPADGAAPADAPTDAAASPPGEPAKDPAATPEGAPAGGPAPAAGPAAPPAEGLGEIPLPPVTQQMPNLPKNFPYPDVRIVQEVPIPTKPRKKLLPGGGAGANPYPFPPIGPPMDSVPAVMEPESPGEPQPEPVGPIEPAVPIEREPYPTPAKPDCNAGGGYGPPQDWRFPKARGHKKCSTNSAENNAVNNDMGNAGNGLVNAAPEDAQVNLRTVQRDDDADEGQTTVHPGSATSVVCSMGTVLFAMVAYFLNVAI